MIIQNSIYQEDIAIAIFGVYSRKRKNDGKTSHFSCSGIALNTHDEISIELYTHNVVATKVTQNEIIGVYSRKFMGPLYIIFAIF